MACFAGNTANWDEDRDGGVYKNITLTNCSVESPDVAGGLLGLSSYYRRMPNEEAAKDLSSMFDHGERSTRVKLVDCSYSGTKTKAQNAAGGFVGIMGGDSLTCGLWTTSDKTVGSNSVVESTAENSYAGGVFGYSWSMLNVNGAENGSDQSQYGIATLSNVIVKTDSNTGNGNAGAAGGIIGFPRRGAAIYNCSIVGDGGSDLASLATGHSTYIGSVKDTNYGSIKNAGGIIGLVSEDYYRPRNFEIDNCSVKDVCIASREYGGGLVGAVLNGKKISIASAEVDGVVVAGSYSGGIIGRSGNSGNSVAISDTSVSNTVFSALQCLWTSHPDGQGNYSGALVGDGKGAFSISNIMLKGNSFNDSSHQGLLIGDAATNDGFVSLRAAGIDVLPGDTKTSKDMPEAIRARKKSGNSGEVNKCSYIAFSNYLDTFEESGVDGGSLYNDDRADDGSEVAVDSANPYVTTNPVSSVKVKAMSGSSGKSLFGDGAAVNTAKTIQEQAGASVAGRYTYTNIGGSSSEGEYQNTNGYNPTLASTFNDNNKVKDSSVDSDKAITVAEADNFPVLLISGNDSTTIQDYLNLVTNGGFSDAARLNTDSSSYVTAKTETFALDSDGSFAKSDVEPSLSVVNNGKSNMLFRASTDWDNGKGRFTLLTVTFNDGANHTYKVQVPIIVKRMLEIDFTATYTHGTDFKSTDYSAWGEGAHVLTSFGDTMTGYLTWTYNKALGAKTEYGWNSHLESGGEMKPLNKALVFGGDGNKGTLPEGTQLTLIDTANSNKEYSYTVGSGGAASVALTEFRDSVGAPYQEKWLSETMGVSAIEDTSGTGAWVELDLSSEDREVAGAKVGENYYRVASDADAGKQRYVLSVGGEEPTPSENFYLVVRVPQGTQGNSVNGYTGTSVSSSVNTNVNYSLRTNSSQSDSHQNTASTYSIGASYAQNLTDNKTSSDSNEMAKSGSVYPLCLDVTDTISVGKNEYTDSDSLYFQLDSSLEKYSGKDSSGNAAFVGAVGYPTGTSGTISFYVKVGSDYYEWTEKGWANIGATEKAAVSKSWSSDGNDMSLVLSDADGNPIDLKGIRKIASAAGESGFSVRMEAVLSMTAPAAEAAIMASQDGSSAFTKPTYRTFLSPHSDTLSTSSMMQYNAGGARYYLKGTGYSTIGLASVKKTQLGINVDDLNSADGTIALVGTYDLSKLNDAEAKINKGEKVTYTLTLQKREENGTYSNVSAIEDYLDIKESDLGGVLSDDASGFVFTDAKGQNGFETLDGDSLAFKLRFTVKVKTDVEAAGHTYANYRLVLTSRLSGGGQDDVPQNEEGIADYTNSDYVTYTLSRVNTKGINPQ